LRELDARAHRNAACAVGDGGAVEQEARAGVGFHLAETALLVERGDPAGEHHGAQ
jgi:hypothetical protein